MGTASRPLGVQAPLPAHTCGVTLAGHFWVGIRRRLGAAEAVSRRLGWAVGEDGSGRHNQCLLILTGFNKGIAWRIWG